MSQKPACNIMIALLIMVLFFHFFVLVEFVDFKNAWGGRLSNKNEMYVFEGISILSNLFLLFIVLQKAKYIKQSLSIKAINSALWVLMFIYIMNTIGNLFALNIFEKVLGKMFTATLSFLSWVIVRQKIRIKYLKE